MRKSKSTAIQHEFMSRIANGVKNSTDLVRTVTETFKNYTEEFWKQFEEWRVKDDNDENKKCREDVERKEKTKCTECQEQKTLEKYVFFKKILTCTVSRIGNVGGA
uniref:Uncharacterized protein n=1 Tax=Caenorhabditis japonica TaxID=281687 RepID=A0A8R1I3B6_CAEJA